MEQAGMVTAFSDTLVSGLDLETVLLQNRNTHEL